jgi:hypothetical protein
MLSFSLLISVDSKSVTHKLPPWQHSRTNTSDNVDSNNPVKVVDVIEVQWIPLQRVLRDIDVLCCLWEMEIQELGRL